MWNRTQEGAVMRSSWEDTKAKSTYHFDTTRRDKKSEVLTYLGNIMPTWMSELEGIIQAARPATWETRGFKGEGVPPPREDLIAEEYDLKRAGADPKMIITHLNWKIPESLFTISKKFALGDCMERIHVQMPGEVWNLHIDKLQKWCPQDPDKVLRVFVQL